MKRLVTGFILAALCAALPAMATTRYVASAGGGQYSTIGTAYTAAVSGDTILIGPGTYSENGINSQKRLYWLGAGWDQTIWNSGTSMFVNTAAASGSVYEGLRIDNNSGALIVLANNVDSVTIRRCYLRQTANSQIISGLGSVSRCYVEDCILHQTATSQLVLTSSAAASFRGCLFVPTNVSPQTVFQNTSGNAGTLELYNCVFLNCATLFNLSAGAQPVIAVNNVFYDWSGSPSLGIYPGASVFDYNASQTVAMPGTNALTLSANPFVTYDPSSNYVFGTSDLHPAGGSALINAGHPSLLDPDGSRSDLGIYGGPKPLVDNGVPNYPWTISVTVSPNVVGQGTPVNGTAMGRVGPQY